MFIFVENKLIMEFKGTKGKWVADLRSGCCAVYSELRINETNGLHSDDDRNIYYSNKGSFYNGNNWEMNLEHQANALLISKAPEMLYLLKDLLHDKGLNEVSRREVELLIKQATEL